MDNLQARGFAPLPGILKAALYLAAWALWAGLCALPAAGADYFLERVEDLPLAQTNHWILPGYSGAEPAQGQSFVDPDTSLTVTRISDVGDIFGISPTWPYDGFPTRGMHNGYSKYSCANVTNEYVIAYGVQPWINGLYRVADAKYMGRLAQTVNSSLGLGETFDVRWDLSGTSGTEYTIYYTAGSTLYKQDVLKGPSSQEALYDFGDTIIAEGHMDQATNATYRAVILSQNKTVVFDLQNRVPLAGVIPSRGDTDISMSGKWFLFAGYVPARFYKTTDLAQGDIGHYVELPTRHQGHDGWAYDANGQEVYVFQDNSTDWMSTFNPETGERIDVINMVEMGWDLNQHMGRIQTPSKKGWMLMSSYCADSSQWDYNQLMLIEIKPAEQHPRIWRLGFTYNMWNLPQTTENNYFAQAFASIDPTGNSIYWGANWNGTDNLELYRMQLPPDWPAALDPQPTPRPTQTPTPTHTPTPEPTPTAVPVFQPPDPTIDSVDLITAPVGAWITIWGIRFGDTQGDSKVMLGFVEAPNVASWSDRRIDFQVPANANSGSLRVIVGAKESNAVLFTVRQGNIINLYPSNPFFPWETLSFAAQYALPGDLYYLRAGVYYEAVNMQVGGTSERPIAFKTYPGEDVMLDGAGLDAVDAITVDAGAYPDAGQLVFSGIRMRNYRHGVRLRGGATGVGLYGLDASQGSGGGLLCEGAQDVTVAQCAFEQNQQFGVLLTGGAGAIALDDCRSVKNQGGLAGGFSADASCTSVTLVRCTAEQNLGTGFDLQVGGLTLDACAALGNTDGLRLTRNATVRNMLVAQQTGNGILCQAPSGAPTQQLLNCTVAACGQIGVDVGATVAVQLQNLLSVGAQGAAILFRGDTAPAALDRVIVQSFAAQPSGGAIVWAGPAGVPQVPAGALLTVDRPEALFINYAGGDVHLAASSLARRFGDTAVAPPIDYDRNSRLPAMAQGYVAAGAYEYDPQRSSGARRSWAQYE